MNYKKIFWGVLFIIIGGAIVLRNLGVVWFEWWQLWRLWPLVLILWGIAMLPIKDLVKLLLSLAAVIIGVFLVAKYDQGPSWKYNGPFNWKFDNRKSWHDDQPKREKNKLYADTTSWESQHLFFPFNENIKKATLELVAAAGTFNLQKPSDNLVDMVREGNVGNYSLTATEKDDQHIVRLTLEKGFTSGENLRHKVDIKLHESPLWDFNFDVGAARIDMDLSPFKTNKIEIDGGASSISLRLGDKNSLTYIKMKAGASSITIEVPIGSGCQVKTNTVLSGKTLKDFKKIGEGYYETENLNQSTNKIYINIDVAVSKLDIKRY